MRRILLALLLTVTTSIFGALPAAAQSGQRCFPETNQCIEGRFREYWEQNGGLAVFGFPLGPTSDQFNADIGRNVPTQWLERNRFELHAANARPYDVLLGRLGADALQAAGIRWQDEPKGQQRAGCLWFAETGHSVCNQAAGLGFRSYWEGHGLQFDGRAGVSYAESLALFGLPLTEPRMETNSSGDTVLTQWFERARFEWHPDKPNEFKVLLGLLGVDLETGLVRMTNPGLPGRLLVQAQQLLLVKADGSQSQTLNTPNQAFRGQLSPDLRRVAYTCTAGGGTGLCVTNLDGSGTTRLNDDVNTFVAGWAPDGTKLAFVSGTEGRRGLYTINVNGGGETLLMAGRADLVQAGARWAPDSKRLVFNTDYSENAVYVVNADGSGLRKIAPQGRSAQWSPNGARIAFQADSGNGDIYAVNPDGSGLTQLTNTPDLEATPSWAPDGTRIAFLWIRLAPASPAPAPNGIGVMTPDGGGKIELLHSDGPYTKPTFAWSPDSRYIAASHTCSRLCGPAQIVGARIDGSQQFLIAQSASPSVGAIVLDWIAD